MPGDISTCRDCGAKNRLGSPPADQVPRCGKCRSALPWVVAATDADFDRRIEAPTPVIVDLWAPWCQPCLALAPILERLAADHAGRLKVVKLDTDANPRTKERFRVQGIPMLLLFRDGEVAETSMGLKRKAELKQWIRPYLAD